MWSSKCTNLTFDPSEVLACENHKLTGSGVPAYFKYVQV